MPNLWNVHLLFVSSITHTLGLIFTNLRAGVAAQIAFRRMTGPLIVRICNHLAWIERHLSRALAHAVAGRPPRPVRQLPRPEPGAGTAIVPRQRKLPLPRREGWLIPLMPPIAQNRWPGGAYAEALRITLADPALAPHLTHPSVQRALRPLCRMLGISDALPPKPPRPEPAGRISEAPTAPATSPPHPTIHPTTPPSPPATPKPRPARRTPHRLKLPMPYPI